MAQIASQNTLQTGRKVTAGPKFRQQYASMYNKSGVGNPTGIAVSASDLNYDDYSQIQVPNVQIPEEEKSFEKLQNHSPDKKSNMDHLPVISPIIISSKMNIKTPAIER